MGLWLLWRKPKGNEMRKARIEATNRYVSMFGGYHKDRWTNYDKDHVLGVVELFSKDGKCLAEITPPFKPLPKSTLTGFLIAAANGWST